MITAVDTNVLVDILRADPHFGPSALDALRRCTQEGRVVACDVVWAELTAFFPSKKSFEDALTDLPIVFSPVDLTAATLTGEMWRQYHGEGGDRRRVIADFLIGAHAMTQADRLLTRDHGFYRKYFKKLQVLEPSS